jgi:hypothetical protein
MEQKFMPKALYIAGVSISAPPAPRSDPMDRVALAVIMVVQVAFT